MATKLYHGDCRTILPTLATNSVTSIVTDPPAGISYQKQKWDSDRGGRDAWTDWMTEIAHECLRVIRPGGYALVWALPKTSHWTATAWENGGWRIENRISQLFATGMAKGRDIQKDIAKTLGAERTLIGTMPVSGYARQNVLSGAQKRTNLTTPRYQYTIPPEAEQYAGWTSDLRPAVEDWWLFRKPLSEKTIAKNVLRWGCGALTEKASNIILDDDEVLDTNSHYFWSSKRRELAESQHPTRKCLTTIEYLAKLITPPGGIILDPMAGSGSLGLAAQNIGCDSILIEQEQIYVDEIRARLAVE